LLFIKPPIAHNIHNCTVFTNPPTCVSATAPYSGCQYTKSSKNQLKYTNHIRNECIQLASVTSCMQVVDYMINNTSKWLVSITLLFPNLA